MSGTAADTHPASIAAPAIPAAVERLVERLFRVFEARSVVLFGSYARGEPTPRSDIDLLAVLPDEERLEEASRRRGQLLAGLFPAVDLVLTTTRELADARGERAAFLLSVMEHGVHKYPESTFPQRPQERPSLAMSTKPAEA
jgi:predicted nucleotidyltransferase